jgi:transposase-like protein
MASALNQPHFKDADKARQYLEAQVWPNGPTCPHCGVIGEHYALKGKTTRPGLFKCKDCREPFTVTVGTVFERSKIPLNVWLQAVYLLCSSKKGMSSHQLHRTLGVTYKTAWFMAHRIRKAMETRKQTQMTKHEKIPASDEAWESGQLGRDKEHAQPIKEDIETQIDEALELQAISIRLQKSLIEDFKFIATLSGLSYQPLMRQVLTRFVDCEKKRIL